jgi:hypothetical protein
MKPLPDALTATIIIDMPNWFGGPSVFVYDELTFTWSGNREQRRRMIFPGGKTGRADRRLVCEN